MSHSRTKLALFVAHRGDLVSYAKGIVGDASHAEDVVQEAWLRFGSVAKDRPLEEPVGYLFRIVRNLAIDSYRRRKREEVFVDPSATSSREETADDAPCPETATCAKQELELLQQAIAELPRRTQQALELRRVHGMTLQEIAAELNLSISSVHEILAQGIAHCRKRVRPGR